VLPHAKETGAAIPKEPIIFFKSTTALCGPNDDVVIPRNSTKTDWEVELAFVISKKASYVEEAEAMNYVAGYCLHNDYRLLPAQRLQRKGIPTGKRRPMGERKKLRYICTTRTFFGNTR